MKFETQFFTKNGSFVADSSSIENNKTLFKRKPDEKDLQYL